MSSSNRLSQRFTLPRMQVIGSAGSAGGAGSADERFHLLDDIFIVCMARRLSAGMPNESVECGPVSITRNRHTYCVDNGTYDRIRVAREVSNGLGVGPLRCGRVWVGVRCIRVESRRHGWL